MAVAVKEIIPAKTAENSQTTQYTALNVYTIIDKFTATNFTGSAVTISVHLVQEGDAPGNHNIITRTRSVQNLETYKFPELVGHVLAPGSYISTLAGTAAAINIRASGREVTQ